VLLLAKGRVPNWVNVQSRDREAQEVVRWWDYSSRSPALAPLLCYALGALPCHQSPQLTPSGHEESREEKQ